MVTPPRAPVVPKRSALAATEQAAQQITQPVGTGLTTTGSTEQAAEQIAQPAGSAGRRSLAGPASLGLLGEEGHHQRSEHRQQLADDVARPTPPLPVSESLLTTWSRLSPKTLLTILSPSTVST